MAAKTDKAKAKPRHAQAAQVAKLNRSTVLVLLLGLAAAAVLFKFVYTAQTAARDEARSALATVEADVTRAEADLAAVRAQRPDSLRGLHERVSALDRNVPTEIDALELAMWLESTVPSAVSGLVVPDPGEAVEVPGIPGMAKVVLPVSAQGPRASLLGWVQQLQDAPTRLITVEQATLTTDEDGMSSLELSLAVWKSTSTVLVPTQPQPGTTTPAPSDPPVPTEPTVPPVPTEPTVPPVSTEPTVPPVSTEPTTPDAPDVTVAPTEPPGAAESTRTQSSSDGPEQTPPAP